MADEIKCRQVLLNNLLDAVKQCQIRFGGRKELATESDPRVVCLCAHFEAMLQHGLKQKNGLTLRQVTDIVSSSLNIQIGAQNSEPAVFWHFVREHLTRHEYQRFLLLSNINTDLGRGRAWLRSTINEHLLERCMHVFINNQSLLQQYYEEWAFLLDQERSSMLPVMAAGLGSILFAIGINNSSLNDGIIAGNYSEKNDATAGPIVDPEPVLAFPLKSKAKDKQRKKKKIFAQVVSLDDADGDNMSNLQSPLYTSAPPTCLSSPTVTVPPMNIETLMEQNSLSIPQSDDVKESVVEAACASHDGDFKFESCSSEQLDSGMSCSLPISGGTRSKAGDYLMVQTLTPVNNYHVGKLIPLPMGSEEPQSEEDSISVPSYSEEMESAASALAIVQRVLQTGMFVNSEQRTHHQWTEKFDDGSLSAGELKQALLTILTQKEELSQQNQMLRNMLNQEVEAIASVRKELEDGNHENNETVEKLEAKLQSLNRENELLKHQLKKYIGAVQMLRQDGCQAHETLANLEANQSRNHNTYIDYHYEATEYEKKLIQVAEMHGELMEFNETLHRTIQMKDTVIRRLRDELIDLRGPLPDDVQTSDEDNASVTSDYDTNSLAAASHALINIWIPSAFLTGGSSDVHHVYQVYIRIRDDEWNVYRRYSQFYLLHKDIKKKDPVFNTFDFPPKKALGNKDARFVEERRKKLQHYLRCVINHLVKSNVELATSPNKEMVISFLPIFGEILHSSEKPKTRKRTNSRNPFSRFSSASTVTEATSPQYTGL